MPIPLPKEYGASLPRCTFMNRFDHRSRVRSVCLVDRSTIPLAREIDYRTSRTSRPRFVARSDFEFSSRLSRIGAKTTRRDGKPSTRIDKLNDEWGVKPFSKKPSFSVLVHFEGKTGLCSEIARMRRRSERIVVRRLATSGDDSLARAAPPEK